MYTCQDNLIEKRLLTSGYRKVGLCMNKPQGKCNHGGINDKWQDKAPAGGINKETNDALVSPHYMWHEAAGQQAVLATRDFFISNNGGLLESVGETVFRNLFSLNGFSLTFVIDVSGSMGDDIKAVKKTCFEILDRFRNSQDAPFNYVLVPFNDPATGPVMETRDVSVLKAEIEKLSANGGGDCPEMALTGLELALKNSLPRSEIFLFTDASAKDEAEKRDSVKTLTEQTKSKIRSYLTGTCGRRRKRDNNEYAQEQSNGSNVRVRRSTYSDIFRELSELSGGSYVMTTKGELTKILKDVELTMNSAPVTVLQQHVTSGQLFVPIDQSLLDFAISVKSASSFTLSLLEPNASPVTHGEKIVDTPTYKVLLIRSPFPQGNWSLIMEGTAPRDVIVTGKSIQDFSYQIMHDKNGFILPIQGRPVADKEYTLQVKPSGVNRNFSIDEVLILNAQGGVVQRFSAQPLNGSLSGATSVRARFTKLEPMMVGMCGTAAGTEKYCRLQTELVFIEKIRLSRIRGETTMMKPGESINVSIVLSNDGTYDDFFIDVNDQLNLLTTYSPRKISLKQGHNITIVSTFSAPAEFKNRTSSLVRVVVKTPRQGTSETYNYLTFAVTTIPQNALIVDTEPPIVNFTGSPANCTKEYQHGENCSTYPWELQFKAQDEQSKANLIVTVTHGNQVVVDTWQEGDVMVGKYSSSCCFPYVELKIYDMYGNTQDISLDNSKERTPTLHPIMFLLLGFTSLMVPPCAPFYPNRESLGGMEAQFTDEEITEQGVLRAVAIFMERHPLPSHSPFTPGQLENLSPLTPASLFQAYYRGPVSAERFSQAIQEIVIGNNFIEQQYEDSEEYFFYCDSFQKANQVIITKRASIIHDFNNNPNNTGAMNNARLEIGGILHIIQKFYSNSNWLEMGQTEPYAGLGIEDVTFFPIVPPAQMTCVPCPREKGMYTCQHNLVEKNLLTSGYRKVGLCINKPQGKCNHGGINDKWQDKAPAGGINKETNDALVSPHYMWHEAAGQQAVLATRDFFISNNGGLLASVGETVFRNLFSLNGYTLTFVIDVSGSMGDDIASVKETCFKILDIYKNSQDAPFNYILVPFNDPAVGPVMETRNVNVLKAKIEELRANGGGDCPELALTGLELALKNSLPRSRIIFFSDASAKDGEEKRDSVVTLIEETKSSIHVYLTGTCVMRTRSNINKYAQEQSNGSNVRVRRSTYSDIFRELSELSGGSYVMTTKGELTKILKDVELTMNSAPVTVLQQHVTSGQLFVPIDQSLLDFAISVKSASSFTLSLLKPNGSTVTDAENIVDTPTYKVLLIHNPSPQGNWSIVTEGTAPCDVIVTGKSIQDFSYQIMHNKNGFILPIQGRPVAGQNFSLIL
uniref:VWFA domain-containing protein n=1 Tax=Eptatretus burgeri TaxID=7764 RepID=A0A8C4NBE1_EPTBU